MLGSKLAISQSAKHVGVQEQEATAPNSTALYAAKLKNFKAVHLESQGSIRQSACIEEEVDDDPELEAKLSGSRRVDAQFRKMLSKTSNNIMYPRAEQELQLNKIMGLVIVLNALMMAIELDYGPEDGAALRDRLLWILIESVFIILFIIELCIRLHWEHWEWVKSGWNWMDLTVVCIGVVESWIISLINTSGSELRMVTLLRIVRLVRLLRVAKLVRAYRAFYVTVMAFKEALESISNILLIIISGIFLCAIFTTSTIGRSGELRALQMGNADGKERFGTVPRSMYSLFELMTLEGWDQVGRPLVMKEPTMGLFFFLFIMIFTFGLLNMIVAMVVEKTLKQARLMEDHKQKESQEDVENELAEMYRIRHTFNNADIAEKGYLTLDEFEAQLTTEDNQITECLKKSGVPTDDVPTLFAILNANLDDHLTFEELLTGIGKIHSAASNDVSFTLLSVQATLRALQYQVKKLDRSTRASKRDILRSRSPSDSYGLSTPASRYYDDGDESASWKADRKSPLQVLRNVAQLNDQDFNMRDGSGASRFGQFGLEQELSRYAFIKSDIETSKLSSVNSSRQSSWITPQPPPVIEDVTPPMNEAPNPLLKSMFGEAVELPGVLSQTTSAKTDFLPSWAKQEAAEGLSLRPVYSQTIDANVDA